MELWNSRQDSTQLTAVSEANFYPLLFSQLLNLMFTNTIQKFVFLNTSLAKQSYYVYNWIKTYIKSTDRTFTNGQTKFERS